MVEVLVDEDFFASGKQQLFDEDSSDGDMDDDFATKGKTSGDFFGLDEGSDEEMDIDVQARELDEQMEEDRLAS